MWSGMVNCTLHAQTDNTSAKKVLRSLIASHVGDNGWHNGRKKQLP